MAERLSYVIVGNGIAGVTAAETLRAEDSTAEIMVIADNPFPAYNRPALKDFLAGRASEDKLWIRPKSFYQDQHIHFLVERVVGINTGQHSVQLQSGRQIGYHQLLLATGARARRLCCPGSNLVGVTSLRTIADYQAVLSHLGDVRQVVVTGSGPLALETVEVLRQQGYQVTHLLRHRTLWSEVLDRTASDIVLQQEWHEGIDMHIEEEITEIVGKNGRVTGIVTTSGARIACEMVIAAIGVEPAIDFIKESGIACRRGVKVDGWMRTNAPDIYAAGDIAETIDAVAGRVRIGRQWYPAIQQGRTAAYSMLGILDTRHLPQASGAYLNYVTSACLFGLDLAAVGLTTMPEDRRGYQEIVADPQPYVYHKALLKDGIAVGMLAIGECKDALAFKRAIDHGVNLAPVASQLFASDFKLTGWLDKQRVPTPVLAVSKVSNATVAQPLIVTRGTKHQFVRVMSSIKEQRQTEHSDAGASVDPYSMPIISVGKPVPAVSPMEAYLVPVFPERDGKERSPEYIAPSWAETKLSQTGILTIGRDPNAALSINHNSISRCHAEITYANGYYLLRDLGSKNGTFLNGARLGPHKAYNLNPSDQVRIGTVMVYMFQVRPVAMTALKSG